MLFAVLKDDLIASFKQQLSDREEQVRSLTAELNSCYARLVESDSLLERFHALRNFIFLMITPCHSACSSLQENVKLGHTAAQMVTTCHIMTFDKL
jgi:hypothetical protein